MALSVDGANGKQARLLEALEELLAIDAAEPRLALDAASRMLARALGADSVAVLAYEASTDSLVSAGALGSRVGGSHGAGANRRQPLVAGGQAATVFRTGTGCLVRRAGREPTARNRGRASPETRSEMLCCFCLDGAPYGVLQVTSRRSNWFSESDLRFLEAVARWVTLVADPVGPVERSSGGTSLGSQPPRTGDLVELTSREREGAALVAGGLTNEEIAERLVLVLGTVANHVAHILRKLGFSRRTQIATWAVQHGLWTVEGQATGEPIKRPFEETA